MPLWYVMSCMALWAWVSVRIEDGTVLGGIVPTADWRSGATSVVVTFIFPSRI
jgi:hypothetical protein